ncbi:MAG: thioredoxin family protein [bacterium]|nr:thioredoxin family protein [bacterium]
MYPAVRDLKKEIGDVVVFIVADVTAGQTRDLLALFEVRYVPHFVVINNLGVETMKKVGAMSISELRNLIEAGIK